MTQTDLSRAIAATGDEWQKHGMRVVDPETGAEVDGSYVYDPPDDTTFTSPPATATLYVNFTPTIPHCSMATLIGLSIRVQLLRLLPSRFKVDVNVTPGTHMNEKDVNKQLSDKERVAAALENENLLKMVNSCLQGIS